MKYITVLTMWLALFASCSDSTEPEYREGVFVVDSLNSSCIVFVDEHERVVSEYHADLYYHFEGCAGTVSSSCCSISVAPSKYCKMAIIDPTPDCDNIGKMRDEGLGSGRLEDWSDNSTAMVYVWVGGELWHCSIFNTFEKIGTYSWRDSIEVEIVSEVE